MPKCIVHGHGGTLLQLMKEHQLHLNMHANDRMFYYTTCSWMMWNYLVTALASHVTILMYDGAPFAPHHESLFEYISQEKATVMGVSAKYLDLLRQQGCTPNQKYDLSALRTVLSTGSPLVLMLAPGILMLEVGLSAILTRISCPEEIPPKMPPA